MATCRWAQSPYEQICYFAPKTIRTQLRRARAKLITDDVIREEEAKRVYVYWYPLAMTEEELELEQWEDDEALGLNHANHEVSTSTRLNQQPE
jgi:hypothetical protein